MPAQIAPKVARIPQTTVAALPDPVVYIVDDDLKTRESLRFLIESPEVAVKTFADADCFLAAYDAARPGCLLLDLKLPGMSGLELLRVLPERGIDVPVIVLTGYGDVPSAVDALKGGAVEFLQKPCKGAVLLKKIRRALALGIRQRAKRADITAAQERLRRLTGRESEILRFVAREWLSSKEIARRLNISRKTVEAHRAKIMEKTEASSVAELVWLVASTEDFS